MGELPVMARGESFIGKGADAAHLNTILWRRDGPEIASPEHGSLTWGAAQAGIAAGVADAVAGEVIAAADCDDLALIAAVWVNPDATDAELVYVNNRAATLAAVAAGLQGLPRVPDVAAARHPPVSPCYTAPEVYQPPDAR